MNVTWGEEESTNCSQLFTEGEEGGGAQRCIHVNTRRHEVRQPHAPTDYFCAFSGSDLSEQPMQKKPCVRQPPDGETAKNKRGRPAKMAASAAL